MDAADRDDARGAEKRKRKERAIVSNDVSGFDEAVQRSVESKAQRALFHRGQARREPSASDGSRWSHGLLESEAVERADVVVREDRWQGDVAIHQRGLFLALLTSCNQGQQASDVREWTY